MQTEVHLPWPLVSACVIDRQLHVMATLPFRRDTGKRRGAELCRSMKLYKYGTVVRDQAILYDHVHERT